MAADMEAVGLSRVHIYEYKCILPLRDNSVLIHIKSVRFSGKKRYEGVRFNVISVTRGWVRGPISRKKALRNT